MSNGKKILVLNGPNLNMLGFREQTIYGSTTLDEIEKKLLVKANETQSQVIFMQSNHEGELVDIIQQHRQDVDGIIINAAAYTHTSIAIRDALIAVKKPVIEVHLSNIYQRETFRHHSMIAEIALGQICGLGWIGYILAFEAMICYLSAE
ncbi:MAG: type II 3-dehydroquinate dehydratase [Anaerolineaceae bacterium]|nr:type II 3-dehydroquinate dehydratase [Anaerolineaceae bacterium]